MARRPTMVPQGDWAPIRPGEPESMNALFGAPVEETRKVSNLREHHRLIAESNIGDEMIATDTKNGKKFRYFVTAESKAKSIRWLRKHGHPVPASQPASPFGMLFGR